MFRPINASLAILLFYQSIFMLQSAVAQDVPFVADVIDEHVSVRAGAGRSFYVVGELTKGWQVTVDEVVFGWYKIEPPDGLGSYVSRAFVDAFGDGKTGKINAARAAVRAASVNGAEDSYRRQIDLIQGETVQIVGQEGSFYKIIPPEGAYVFLPPGSVRPVATQVKPAVATSHWRSSSAVPGVVVGQVEPTGHGIVMVESAPSQDMEVAGPSMSQGGRGSVLQPSSALLRSAEQRLLDAQELPLEQQPIQALFQEYKAMASDSSLSLVDSRIVAMRVAQLRQRIAVAKALQEISIARQEHQTITQLVEQLPKELPKQRYDLRGLLRTSSVYNGTNLPRLYRVTEADGHRVIAYARLNPILNPAPLLGEYVGIVGPMTYDAALKLEVIEANFVDLISSTAAR